MRVGLTWNEARGKIIETFELVCSNHKTTNHFQWSRFNKYNLYMIAVIELALLLVSLALQINHELTFGLSISILFIFIYLIINQVIEYFYEKNANIDLYISLKQIINQFEGYYNDQILQTEPNINNPEKEIHLPTGHSQVSIINVFRNDSWMKIPTLLLVEGDIIALMGGDVTPCDVFELTSEKASTYRKTINQIDWTKGNLIAKGSKIHLDYGKSHVGSDIETKSSIPDDLSDQTRDSKEKIKNENERHRIINSESIEILRLCGNIRCFQVAETPIEKFVLDLYAQQEANCNSLNEGYIPSLMTLIKSELTRLLVINIILFLLASLFRLVFITDVRDHFTLAILIPLATILIFFVPFIIPTMKLLHEAIGTADLLTTLEVTLHALNNNQTNQTNNQSNPEPKIPTSNEEPNINVMHDMNEFVDEDLDERVEDIAEETDAKVTYYRFLSYMYTIIKTRIFGRNVLVDNINQLMVPLAGIDFLRNLGQITMVTFLDDDIIFEGYSVTEEIFLLNDAIHHPSTKQQRDANKFDSGDKMDSEKQSNKLMTSSSVPKGIVLDLHANPEATGSRFENPLWWKYLPSLKPLGLNSLLTYKHTSDEFLPSTQMSHNKIFCEPMFNQQINSEQSNIPPSNPYEVEKSLVHHIRKTLPLEFLCELSEEIGFTGEDTSCFNLELNVNVFAPGLENAHLLEDNHQWGQEESRRRGSILPKLRGGIYKDQRGGGLQMMCIGDPSLVMNYCKEYWDGSTCSITPLSSSERTEVLNVFERWKLEDFDVVSFCYSPVPMAPLLQLQANNYTSSSRKRSMSGVNSSIESSMNKSLFFIDPYSADQLAGKKTNNQNKTVSNYSQRFTNTIPTIPEDDSEQQQESSKKIFQKKAFSPITSEFHKDRDIEEKEIFSSEGDSQKNPLIIPLIDPGRMKRNSLSGDKMNMFQTQGEDERSKSISEIKDAGFMTESPKTPLTIPVRSRKRSSSDSDLTMNKGSTSNYETQGDFEKVLFRRESHGGNRSTANSPIPENKSAHQLLDLETIIPLKSVVSFDRSPSRKDFIDPLNTTDYGFDSNESVHEISNIQMPMLDFDEQLELSNNSIMLSTKTDPASSVQHDPNSEHRPHHHHHHHHHHNNNGQRKARQPKSRTDQVQKQQRRTALRQLWSTMRQQIFLGMAASSVPVRNDVPNVKEDLNAAGIRFVYFSPQNMKRSKPVAEKIGIPFDWNCAISLRTLDNLQADPHRHISTYADWDVMAKMPHGIEAIKEHIRCVDNVPLLVSLFTDSTPQTIQQMIEIFRENGEVVLAIGSGYRAYNQTIFRSANIATSVSILPNIISFLPANEKDLITLFPQYSNSSLSRADLRLSFDLVGMGTVNLLQMSHNTFHSKDVKSQIKQEDSLLKNINDIEHLRLSVLLETIHKGRILLLNELQALAFYLISIISLGCWAAVSHFVPLSIPPYCPVPIAILFAFFYLPLISLSMLFTLDHEGVMRNTPRKNFFSIRQRDSSRFYTYLLARVLSVLFSILLVGYLTTASTFLKANQGFLSGLHTYQFIFTTSSTTDRIYDIRGYWLVQDMMANTALLCLMSQSFTLLIRGQTLWKDFPWPSNFKEYYTSLVFISIVHIFFMVIRDCIRNCMFPNDVVEFFGGFDCSLADNLSDHRYYSLHYSVWITFALSTLLNIFVGEWYNRDDNFHYRRYLQFLRLEFDTRLGMHSPR